MPVRTHSRRHAVEWGRLVHVSRSWQANHVRLQPFTSQPLIASDAQDQREHHQCDPNEREPIALAAEVLPIFVARDSSWQCDKNQAASAPCERDSRTLVRVYAELIKWHSTTAALCVRSRSRPRTAFWEGRSTTRARGVFCSVKISHLQTCADSPPYRCIHARRLGVSSTHSPSAAPVNPHPRRRRRGT